ncbi:MAG: hypothetical protein FJ264_15105 [Planctomycetes bacterium]|nr:hypothetical protein [Planctomycetota bacterium]
MRNLFKLAVNIVLPVYLSGIFMFQVRADNFETVRAAESENLMEKTEQERSDDEGAWTGIDVSIVGKYAEKYGRPPRDPYINTDQGDLLLFVFTLAGVVGGFVIGFNVRKIFYEKQENR